MFLSVNFKKSSINNFNKSNNNSTQQVFVNEKIKCVFTFSVVRVA